MEPTTAASESAPSEPATPSQQDDTPLAQDQSPTTHSTSPEAPSPVTRSSIRKLSHLPKAESKPTATADATTPGTRKNQIQLQLFGFSPLDILESITFPNDKYDTVIRLSKSARLRAIRGEPIITGDQIVKTPLDSTAGSPDSEPGAEPFFKVKESKSSHGRKAAVESTTDSAWTRRAQLARQAALITIQTFWRCILIRRKFLRVMHYRLSNDSTVDTFDLDGSSVSDLEKMFSGTLQVQEKLIRRYTRYCRMYERNGGENEARLPPSYQFYCATYIQAHFRMRWIKRAYLEYMESTDKDFDALEDKIDRFAGGQDDTLMALYEESANKIQTCWKSFYNLKIYRFYRDLIKFRQSGDPKNLLKYINPQEAHFIDSAAGVHVRFRLGGASFPPTIYYKIFTHNSLVDLNSFAPRDYTREASKMTGPGTRFNHGPKTTYIDPFDVGPAAVASHDGWYKRIDNNGWRLVSQSLLLEDAGKRVIPFKGPIHTHGRIETKSYHHDKKVRQEAVDKKRRKKKKEWMGRMYQIEMPGEEEDDVLSWSLALNFDEYVTSWTGLATTAIGKSEPFELQHVVEQRANSASRRKISTSVYDLLQHIDGRG